MAYPEVITNYPQIIFFPVIIIILLPVPLSYRVLEMSDTTFCILFHY